MVSVWDVAVNEARNSNEHPATPPRRPAALTGLIVLLALECAALVAAAVFLVVELLIETPTSVASAVGITVIVAASAVWVAFIIAGLRRGAAWTRAAVVVVQVLFGAVAIGSFQGPMPRIDLGIALLVPAVLALVLLFTKSVIAATADRESDPKAF